MKRNIMIWAIAGIVYLGVVIGGYSTYASVNQKTDEHTNHTADNQDAEKSHNEHTNHGANEVSELTPKVSYANEEIRIELKDKNNKAPKLEVSHEKLMHLIVVSSDLKEYHHLHPEEKNKSVYSQKFDLPDNSYKVFVDIKPKDLNYAVEPIQLHVGKTHKEQHANDLVIDTDYTKTINNQAIELTTREFEVNKEIKLNFDVKNNKPEPYLGALGHVVILDEKGEEFIHVHPVSNDKTVFETQFSKPGVYKLWAEFKFGGHVNAYPFVIEVK